MDANTQIAVAAEVQRSRREAETGSSPLAAGSSPQRRESRDTGESAAMDEREAAELVRLKGRLMAEYGPSLGPDVAMRCIAEAIDFFDEAPVRTYVILLVERRAIAQLRHEARRTAADPGDGQGRPS
jgi:uncharacterized protein involved in type VI secretion and phage assembly